MNIKKNDYRSTVSNQIVLDISSEQNFSLDGDMRIKKHEYNQMDSQIIKDDVNDQNLSDSNISIHSEFNLQNILQNHVQQIAEEQIHQPIIIRNNSNNQNIQRQITLHYQQQGPESQLNVAAQNYNSEQSNSSFFLQDYDKKDLIQSIQSCLYCYIILILYFTTLFISSITLTTLNGKETGIQILGGFCILTNFIHCFTLIKELYCYAKEFQLKLKENNLNEIKIQLREIQQNLIDFYAINLFFFSRIEKLLNANIMIYALMFFWIGTELNYKQVPYWFAIPQLILGVLFIFCFITFFMCLCVLLPLILCEQRHILQEENFIDINDINLNHRMNLNQQISIISLREILLIEPIEYQDLDEEKKYQPCYICLQEYLPNDLVIPLNCQAQHLFHQQCINSWIDHHNTCPVCKEVLQ